MEKENIHIDWEVISKSFRGELSGKEQERLEGWLAASSRHRDFYRRALEGGKTDATVGVNRDVLAAKKDELMRRACVMKGDVNPRRALRFVWYAAAVILPVAIAVGMWVNMGGREKNVVIAQRVQPGSGRAVLELHDGRTYFLDTTRVVETGIEGNLAKAEKQSLVYTKQEAEELVYNKVIVPRAGEYSLTLSDGTRVWLNSESELRYPVDFVGTERKVFLKGEAYFQVAKDATKPFRVMVNDMQVEALGTEFNINAYRDDDCLRTTLAEGKVRVSYPDTRQECILVPGEQAVLKEGVITTGQVNVDDIIAWKKGRFVFSDMSLEAIAHQLERWYDVEIRFDDTVAKYYRFTGVMKRYNELEQVLGLIEETTNVRFKVEGQQVKVFRNL